MKKFSIVLLAIIILLILSSCNGHAESEKVFKALEEELGLLSEIPVEMEQAVKKLGDGVKQYEPAHERDKGQALAISDNTVLYSTARTDTEREGSKEFKFEIVTLYIGKVKSRSDGETLVTIGAANVKMNVLSEDVTGAKEAMLDSTNGAPISQKAKSMMKDLIDGKQVTVSAGSNDWEVFCDLDREVTFVCSEDGTFKLKKKVEVGQLYRDTTEDSQGRPLKKIAYYYDEQGNEYIEDVYDYEYNADDSVVITYTYYYYNTHQIKTVTVSESLPVNIEDGAVVVSGRIIYSKEYYKNGQLKEDRVDDLSSDDEDSYNETHYFEDGSKAYEHIYKADGSLTEASYNEAGETLYHYERFSDGSVVSLEQSFYKNGQLERSAKFIGEGESSKCVWDKTYYENGQAKRLIEYYESGRMKSRYDYYESGDIVELVDYYDGEDNRIKQAIYENGQKTCFFPDGQMQCEIIYFDKEMTLVHTYAEWYENGQEKETYENDEKGELITLYRHSENGDILYSYTIDSEGRIDETERFDGGIRYRTLFPNGDKRIDESYDDGRLYYYYYTAAYDQTSESFYNTDPNDPSIMIQTESRYIYGDGSCRIWKYYPNGKHKYEYYKDADGKVTETYYNELGYPIS